MSKSFPRVLFACTALATAGVLAGCGNDNVRAFGMDAGATGGLASGGAGGTGGGSATGGSGGSFLATGGTSASGGTSATGGRASSGGTNATGGAVGSGGRGTSTGGVVGSGGRGTGGAGTGGANPAVCNQLAADYQKEMPKAKECSIGIGLSQCQIEVPGSLGCGAGCTTYVQEANNLNDLKRKWIGNGCDNVDRICTAIACVEPKPGNCGISAIGSPPRCQDGSI